MYNEIINFAKEKGCSIIENRKTSKVCGYIHLDEFGNYLGIEVIEKPKQEQKLLADFGSFSRVELQPNPISEKASNILDKTSKKYPLWVSTMKDGDGACQSLSIIWKFIEKYDSDKEFEAKVYQDYLDSKLGSSVISFSIGGQPIEDMKDWTPWVDEKVLAFKSKKGIQDSVLCISSLSGDIQELVPSKSCPEIKNVPNDIKAAFGIGSGVYTVSMGESSFSSYGQDGSQGSLMGIKDAKDFAAGVEYLLNHKEHNNKDFQLIYFYDKEVENIINETLNLENYDEEDLEDLLNNSKEPILTKIFQSVKDGTNLPTEDLTDAKFYMARFYSPSRGRCILTNYIHGDYITLLQNIQNWYADTLISEYDKGIKKDYVIRKFYSVLFRSILNKVKPSNEDIKKQLNQETIALLEAIYLNKQIPYKIFDRIVLNTLKDIKSNRRIKTVNMQIIKCYLRRSGNMIKPELFESDNVAYNCGRLFAIFEQVQYKYHSSNGKIIDKPLSATSFDMVMKNPQAFTKLSVMNNKYLTKLHGTYYPNLIAEVTKKIGTSFPKKFSQEDAGAFVLGYYQQHGDFFKKSEKTIELTDEINNDEE